MNCSALLTAFVGLGINLIMRTNMKIIVNKEGNIGSVQDQFNAYFPYLKLEFYGLHDAMVKSTTVKPFMDPRYKPNDSRKSVKGAK